MAVIPTYESQKSLQPLPGVRVRSAATPEAYGVGVVQAGQRALGAAIEKKQEFEYAEALEALNMFQAEVDKLHLDPDSGLYNTRKLGAASGMMQDADGAMRELGQKYLAKMNTPFMKNAFGQQAQRILHQQNRANSKWEYAQIDAYKTNESNSMIVNGYNKVALYYDDDEAVALERENMLDALEYQLRGAGPEAREAKIAELENNISLVRFQRKLEDDPRAAAEWYEEHKIDFTGEWQGKIEKLLSDKLERIQVQETVDWIVGQFGIENPQDTISWIRENYEGDMEDSLVAAYKTWVSELTVKSEADAMSRSQLQNEYWDSNLAQKAATGQLTESELYEAANNGYISWDKYRTEVGRLNVKADRTAVTNGLKKQFGEQWNKFTQAERDAYVMTGMGVTQGDRESALEDLRKRILDPESDVSAADIAAAYDAGQITKAEADSFKKALSGYGDHQQKIVSYEKTQLQSDLDQIFSNQHFQYGDEQKDKSQARRNAISDFNAAVADLDPNSPTYAEEVRQARRTAITNAVEESNKKLAGSWSGKPTAFGKEWQAIQESMDAQPIQNYEPTFRTDDVNLKDVKMPSPVQQTAAVAAGNPTYGPYQPTHSQGRHISDMPQGLTYTPSTGPVTTIPANMPRMQTLKDTHGAYITELSQRYGVPENLIYGLIQQESGGNPNALSKAGAMGYMQLMPATAKGLGVDPSDPRQNLDGGVRYLSQKLKEWNGNVEYALSAYHSGNGNVNKAVQGKKALGPEGRGYAPKVIAHSQRYGSTQVAAAPTPASSTEEGARLKDPDPSTRLPGVTATPDASLTITPEIAEQARQQHAQQYLGTGALGPVVSQRMTNVPRTGEEVLRFGSEEEY